MELTKKTFLATIIGGLILALILTVTRPSLARIMLSLLFIFFLPGYGITAILFPRRALDLPARLLLSITLSLVTTAFSGLVLDATPLGVSLRNPLLILLIAGSGLVGLYSLGRDILQFNGAAILARKGFNARQMVLLVFAVSIAVLAVAVARTPTSPKDLVGYTLFWAQPGDVPDSLKLGVQSEEFVMTKYQIRSEINEVMGEGPTFVLMPGETWEYSLNLDKSLAGQPITFLLYRLDKPDEPYRRVVWWYEND